MLSLAEDRNITNQFQREILECQTLEGFKHILSLGVGHVVRTGSVEEDSNSTCCYSLGPTGKLCLSEMCKVGLRQFGERREIGGWAQGAELGHHPHFRL